MLRNKIREKEYDGIELTIDIEKNQCQRWIEH